MIRRRPRSDANRASAMALAIVALALVGGQLVRALHMLVVRHAACAEHGLVVHAEAEQVADDAARPATTECDQRAAHAARTGRGARDVGHEHCDGLAIEQGLVLTCPPPVARVLDSYLLPVAAAPQGDVARRSPLDSAPKTSPPRA